MACSFVYLKDGIPVCPLGRSTEQAGISSADALPMTIWVILDPFGRRESVPIGIILSPLFRLGVDSPPIGLAPCLLCQSKDGVIRRLVAQVVAFLANSPMSFVWAILARVELRTRLCFSASCASFFRSEHGSSYPTPDFSLASLMASSPLVISSFTLAILTFTFLSFMRA